MEVNSSRQRTWLMLAMTILWIAIPAFACLPALQPTGQHACCHSMARACAPATVSADNSCCRVHPQNLAIHLALPYFSEHAQQFAFVSHPIHLPVPATKNASGVQAFAPVPSILSSANTSILRISDFFVRRLKLRLRVSLCACAQIKTLTGGETHSRWRKS